MGGWGGLVELVLVFGLVLGFGFVQLRSVRRDSARAKREDEKRAK